MKKYCVDCMFFSKRYRTVYEGRLDKIGRQEHFFACTRKEGENSLVLGEPRNSLDCYSQRYPFEFMSKEELNGMESKEEYCCGEEGKYFKRKKINICICLLIFIFVAIIILSFLR